MRDNLGSNLVRGTWNPAVSNREINCVFFYMRIYIYINTYICIDRLLQASAGAMSTTQSFASSIPQLLCPKLRGIRGWRSRTPPRTLFFQRAPKKSLQGCIKSEPSNKMALAGCMSYHHMKDSRAISKMDIGFCMGIMLRTLLKSRLRMHLLGVYRS